MKWCYIKAWNYYLLLSAGSAYHSLKTHKANVKPQSSPKKGTTDETTQHWASLQNRLLVPLVEQLFQHITRLLSICAHVIDGTQPGPPKAQVGNLTAQKLSTGRVCKLKQTNWFHELKSSLNILQDCLVFVRICDSILQNPEQVSRHVFE